MKMNLLLREKLYDTPLFIKYMDIIVINNHQNIDPSILILK